MSVNLMISQKSIFADMFINEPLEAEVDNAMSSEDEDYVPLEDEEDSTDDDEDLPQEAYEGMEDYNNNEYGLNDVGTYNFNSLAVVFVEFKSVRGLIVLLSNREGTENEKLEPIEYYHEHMKMIEMRAWICRHQITARVLQVFTQNCPSRAKELVLRHDLPDLMFHATEVGYRSHSVNEKERESVVNALQAFSNDVKDSISPEFGQYQYAGVMRYRLPLSLPNISVVGYPVYYSMVHLPFKIANHIVADLEKGGRVLQDVHSTVRGHISQLPDEVLECILNKLKHRDAVRASLVSCRWRHLVLSRARLVFYLPSMFEMENCDLKGASGRKCVCLEYKDRFVQAVNQFIASYRGTHINEFVVYFCLKRDSASAVLNWIRFALDFGVQLFDVQIYGEHCKAKVPLCGTRCEIPLKHLLPSNRDAGETFILRPFSQLKALIFHRICLKSHCMETLLSSLVNLKQLEMKQCQLPSYLNLNSLTSLEGVSVFHCTRLEKIDVASLKLKSLKVLCRRIVSLELTGVPNLEELCYSVHGGSMHHIFMKLPELLPRLTTLRVDSSSNWVGA
ncbi:hypothetical protein DM860_016389 [Cuscuta australis]|uniref:F-box domain-containing protein n=1 Tax=Cuscuta australis TaxID=267555 RepID=A0A328DJA1_9ASTE|nr:hypothetical protein DM860_016389 [Cuscuta australis]